MRNLYTGSPLVNNEVMHALALRRAKEGEIVLVHDHYYGDCRVTSRVKATKFKNKKQERTVIDDLHVLYVPAMPEEKK